MDCISYYLSNRIINNNYNRRDRIDLWALKIIKLEMVCIFLLTHIEKNYDSIFKKKKKCKTHTKEKENNNECCHSEEQTYLEELKNKL